MNIGMESLVKRLRVDRPDLRLFGLLFIALFAIELLLCFSGPIAFLRKPTLMLFPPYSVDLTDEESVKVIEYLEREIALTNSYSIISHSFIEEYFIRTDPDGNMSKIVVENATEAHEISRELGLERFAIATVWKAGTRYQVSVTVKNVRDGEIVRKASRYISSMEVLEGDDGSSEGAEAFREKLSIETKGVGFTDYLVIALLAIQLLVGLVALFGREPGMLVEAALAPAIILFLFAVIHSRSANMDYVQRYIANGGALKIAQDTTTALLYAFLRYGPILLLDGAYYIRHAMKKKRVQATLVSVSWLHRGVEPWALFWTVVSAGLYALSFPSFARLDGLGPLAWIGLVPFFLVMLSVKPASAVFYGVVFGTIQALIVNYWHGTYNYVTLHMITIAFVVEYVLFMIPFVLTIRLSGKWGFLIAPAAWTLFDYLRSSGILGYPWGLAGTSQYGFTSLIQLASITGVWGIGFIVLLANSGIAWSLAGSSLGWRWPTLSKRTLYRFRRYRENYLKTYVTRLRLSSAFPLLLSGCIVGAAVAAGAVILKDVRERLAEAPETATVVLLQQNTDPRKHEYKKNTDILIELTDEALALLPETPDLIAWPEGGFKLDIRYWTEEKRQTAYWGRVVHDFLEYQKNLGTWLATGTQDHALVSLEDGSTEKKNYNSSVFLDPNGNIEAFYHKMRLVPFSEHFPLDKEKYVALYEMFQEYDISNWATGDTRGVFEHGKMRVATPICFEDVFPDHVRRFVRNDVDVILNMSNDYWSLSPVEGRQHGTLALFRAVENQRPVLRSTSSGYTVYISATGEIQPGAPEPYTEGYAIAEVPLPETRYTFYTRHGDWFPKACGAVVLASLLLFGTSTVIKLIMKKTARVAMLETEIKRHAG